MDTDEPIFDEELTMIEEVVDFFDSTLLIYDWQTELYKLDGAMVAYRDDNGDLYRTNNDVNPLILESCWNHHIRLTNG